ncbi:MAG TPA: plastocyanin/azurin family copper-binding protein [Nitrosarchaeum sp.]|nr:plastocyanin/azurin family copper-binding protein [Nitrosarchaeum sp.]
MVSKPILIGIIIGVFFAGLGIGYAVLQFGQPNYSNMTPQQMQQMMNDPKQMTQWHQTMMNNPQAMSNWMNTMMQNPNMMNQWMGTMMNNPNFQQQYMGPWMMMRDPQFMQQMRNQWYQGVNLENSAVQTDQVSILADTWQYQSTKAFSPSVIKVSSGTTVTWKNDDQIIHTVTDLGNSFDSGFIQAGQTWNYKFDSKNTYYYFCSIHPWMRGAIIVS